MVLRADIVRGLIDEKDISQNQFAEMVGVSRGYLSNSLNGKRGAGRKLISGLLRTFPDKSLDTFIENEAKEEEEKQ